MADAYRPRISDPNDGWGPSTSVRSKSADGQTAPPAATSAAGDWSAPRRSRVASTPARSPRQRDTGLDPRPRDADAADEGWQSGPARRRAREQLGAARFADAAPAERGLRWWTGLGVLIAVVALGLLVDGLRGQQLGIGVNVGIIVGSVLAVLLVRRSAMFPVVVAPPIVYSISAGIVLYIRSGGLHDHGVLIDVAANWLVYGFPAIAAATAAVLSSPASGWSFASSAPRAADNASVSAADPRPMRRSRCRSPPPHARAAGGAAPAAARRSAVPRYD